MITSVPPIKLALTYKKERLEFLDGGVVIEKDKVVVGGTDFERKICTFDFPYYYKIQNIDSFNHFGRTVLKFSYHLYR